MSLEERVFRLYVAAEADPGSLARVIERFANLNVVPRRLLAELDTAGELSIQVDVASLPEETVRLISGKLGEVPCILASRWALCTDDL